MKKIFRTYSVIFGLVVLVSFIQVSILVNELYSVVDGAIEASAKTESPAATPLPTTTPVVEQIMPTSIEIAKINLQLPVVFSPLKNGTWKVNNDVASFAEGTSFINDQSGNIGLFAHDRIKGFRRIKELQTGDTIILKGDNTIATYQVEISSIAKPDAIDVYYATSKPQLTLVTCDGIFSEKRYVVTASLLSIEKTAPTTITTK